jgi:DNA-binding CsgD family transcriptional regulator
MALRNRRMRREDVWACVQLMASHPDFMRQYGSSSDLLRKAWLRQFGSAAFRGVVFEEIHGAETRMFGVGVLVFVTDDFVEEAKRPPYFWLGPELATRMVNGNSPVLSDKDLRRLNSTSGLNVVPWPLGCRVEDVKRVEVTSLAIGSFIEQVRGYQLKEFLAQSSVEEETLAMVGAGCTLAANGVEHTNIDREGLKVLKHPYVVYLRRERALSSYGSWAGGMFVHEPARIGFATRQQELLIAALRGGTDEELAEELEVSISAVKKAWQSIYAKAEASGAVMDVWNSNGQELTERGKERKRGVLTYVRAHLEELRPVDMKLVNKPVACFKGGKPM